MSFFYESGQKVWQGKSSSEPGVIVKNIRRHAPDAAKVGFETGPLSTWHWHELQELGLPVGRSAHDERVGESTLDPLMSAWMTLKRILRCRFMAGSKQA